MRAAVVATAMVLVLGAGSNAGAEIYRWVDDHGVTHLDDNVGNVPEERRDAAKVYHARTTAPPADAAAGPPQSAFAAGIARELGLLATDTQDPVSVLSIVGIYPSRGWNSSATLTPAVTDEVVRAARAAARGHRLPQTEAAAEAAVLRISSGLGVAGPPPTAEPEPREPEPPLVVTPNIIVAPPPPTVIVHTVEGPAPPVLTGYGFDTAFTGGVPFAAVIGGPAVTGPIPNRITPLSDPGGHLRGPLVQPLPPLQPFRRPPNL